MNYDFVPLPDRKPLRWPNGARLALILPLNAEYWELSRPGPEPLYPGGPATIPHVLPGNVADTANWTWREYGQRIGVWRVIDVLDKAGVAASCTINALTAIERRRIVDAFNERGWEIVAHNWAQNDILSTYALDEAKEREVVGRTLDAFEAAVGRPARGWLSSSLRSTIHTPDILKERGLSYLACYVNDDQPYLLKTRHGPLVSIPYSNDINDFAMFSRGAMTTSQALDMFKEQFDQLYMEGAETGRIMNIGLHPHVIGQAFAIRALREFIDYAKGHDKVWFARRDDIADWYMANHASHIG